VASDVRRLRAVRGPSADDLPRPARVCKRPRCGNDVTPPAGRSRPALFCGERCRRAYAREKAAARAALLEAQRLAIQYEVDSPVQQRARRGSSRAPDHSQASAAALGIMGHALDHVAADLDAGAALSARTVVSRLRSAKCRADRLLLDLP